MVSLCALSYWGKLLSLGEGLLSLHLKVGVSQMNIVLREFNAVLLADQCTWQFDHLIF